ncbi:MAG: hypothetical protein EXS37_11815 [Opitutus sp.]|nr:hypothetical protein [Opitutus sp.]
MLKRRIKFVWGASRVIRGRWYLGLVGIYDREEGVRGDGLAVSVRGVLLWGGFLAVVMWFVAALVLFWIWERDPYSALTYEDALFYPTRRAEIAKKNGRAFISAGQDLFRAKK